MVPIHPDPVSWILPSIEDGTIQLAPLDSVGIYARETPACAAVQDGGGICLFPLPGNQSMAEYERSHTKESFAMDILRIIGSFPVQA